MTRSTALAAACLESPAGPVTITVSARGLSSITLGSRCTPFGDADLLRDALARLQRTFSGTPPVWDLPLDYGAASAFDRDVWEACRAIPAGEVRTYGELAEAIGRPGAARATGSALGRNPLAIAVPCHRVLRADGGLGGFGGGLDWKRFLLNCDGARLPRLHGGNA